MNKLALFSLALVLMTSCENQDNEKDGKLVDVRVSTTLPGSISSYAIDHSHDGGIENLNDKECDLRYIVEFYEKKTVNNPSPKTEPVHRMVKILDNPKVRTVDFNARLVALEYDVLVWADFVAEGSYKNPQAAEDLYYITESLKNVQTKDYSTNMSDERRDAYAGHATIDLSSTEDEVSVTLKRPFAKLRIISSDVLDNYTSEVPLKAEIQYESNLENGYNVLTGLADAEIDTRQYSSIVSECIDQFTLKGEVITPVNENYYLLAFDYILATKSNAIAFTINTYGANNRLLGSKKIDAVPLKSNKLTTVYGSVYASSTEVKVDIDESFTPREGL